MLPVSEAFGQLAAPLRLSLSAGAGGLVLQWPLSGAGSALTATRRLSAANGWQSVTNAVQNTGTTFKVTLPWGSAAAGFYRLESN